MEELRQTWIKYNLLWGSHLQHVSSMSKSSLEGSQHSVASSLNPHKGVISSSKPCLRKSKSFEWTSACEEALSQLKRYLTSPPLLLKPKDRETLYIYLAVLEVAVSAVLIWEEESKQLPVYYVTRALLDAETRYTKLEKLALVLVMAARKLHPYFQCHLITVLTIFPFKTILHKPKLSRRFTKWAVELSEFDITFQPQTTIKSQVLANFIVDFIPNIYEQAEKELFCKTEGPQLETWTLHVDGSSNFKRQ